MHGWQVHLAGDRSLLASPRTREHANEIICPRTLWTLLSATGSSSFLPWVLGMPQRLFAWERLQKESHVEQAAASTLDIYARLTLRLIIPSANMGIHLHLDIRLLRACCCNTSSYFKSFNHRSAC